MADIKGVLLIDDDEMLHKFLDRALTRLGYNFHGSTTATGGLEKYGSEFKSILLVLLDLSLPDLRPEAIIQGLAGINPNVKIIISSGSIDINDPIGDIPGVFAYLPKPFTLDDLKAVLAKAQSS